MNSRERVLLTLQHKEPDKVPIDFGGMRSTGIMAIAYASLKKYLGDLNGEIRVYDIGQQLADIEKSILNLFEVDIVDLMNSFIGPEPGEWKEWMLKSGDKSFILQNNYPSKRGTDWVLKDIYGNVFSRMPENSLYFDPCNPGLEVVITKKDIEDYKLHHFTDEELKLWERKAKYIFENTDYAIMGGFGGNMLEGPQESRGWINFMSDLVTGENYLDELLDKYLETYMINLKMYLQAVGKYIQLIQMGDDLGTQRGPIISPDLYRDKIKPRHSKLYKYIRETSNLFVFLHSCGSIYKLIPDLIEAGVQVLNPVQTNAEDMDPMRLKKEFGDQLTFWGGGCETQNVLLNGKPEEIEQQVKERLNIFSPGGGYVFCQVHNIQAGVPPENILAMFDAAKRFRIYSKNIA